MGLRRPRRWREVGVRGEAAAVRSIRGQDLGSRIDRFARELVDSRPAGTGPGSGPARYSERAAVRQCRKAFTRGVRTPQEVPVENPLEIRLRAGEELAIRAERMVRRAGRC
jgi:hypothetical protein